MNIYFLPVLGKDLAQFIPVMQMTHSIRMSWGSLIFTKVLCEHQIMPGIRYSLGFLLDVEDAPAVFSTESSRTILIDIIYASGKCVVGRNLIYPLISDQTVRLIFFPKK